MRSISRRNVNELLLLASGLTISSTAWAAVQAILEATDEDVIRANVKRLLINPKSDSIASVIGAATKLLNAGVMMKRRALGLDAAKGPVPAVSDERVLSAKVRMVLDQDPDALMQVRDAALRVSRLRPDEIIADEEMERGVSPVD